MPQLTEQEQQEIIRFAEADKPLPDKFRFLLFEDKREVELSWNGKSSEVSSSMLHLLSAACAAVELLRVGYRISRAEVQRFHSINN